MSFKFIFLQEEEDAVQFANRVKAAIARKGGLADLLWWVHLLKSGKHIMWLKRMQIDILKWNKTQSFCVVHVHRDGGLKRGKVKEVFKEEQQKLYSKVLVGSSEDRSRSWRESVVCLNLQVLLGAHSESLKPQQMQCGPRLAPSWTCSDCRTELMKSLWVGGKTVLPDPWLTAVPQELLHHCMKVSVAFNSWADYDFSFRMIHDSGVRVTQGILEWIFFFPSPSVTVLNICALLL